jgi:hypothetical protein
MSFISYLIFNNIIFYNFNDLPSIYFVTLFSESSIYFSLIIFNQIMVSKKIRQILCPKPGYTSKSGFKCSIHDFSAPLYHIVSPNRTVFTKNDPVQKALFRNHNLRQTRVNKSKKWKRSFSPSPNSFREFLAIPWKVHISPGSCLISEQKNKKKRLVRSLLFLYSENIWMSPFLVAGRCHPVGVSLRIALIHSDVYFSAFPFSTSGDVAKRFVFLCAFRFCTYPLFKPL